MALPKLSLQTKNLDDGERNAEFVRMNACLDSIRSLSQSISSEHARLEQLDMPGPSSSTAAAGSGTGTGSHTPTQSAIDLPKSPLSQSLPLNASTSSHQRKMSKDVSANNAHGGTTHPIAIAATTKGHQVKSYDQLEEEFKHRRAGADAIMSKLNELATALKKFHNIPETPASLPAATSSATRPRSFSQSIPHRVSASFQPATAADQVQQSWEIESPVDMHHPSSQPASTHARQTSNTSNRSIPHSAGGRPVHFSLPEEKPARSTTTTTLDQQQEQQPTTSSETS